jgi:hypothetical protein
MHRSIWIVAVVVSALVLLQLPADVGVVGRAAAQTGPGPAYTVTGPLVADTGFRPTPDGFGFSNYGSHSVYENLTAAEMRLLFGDVVCATTPSDTCTLTPPAQQWETALNRNMGGGHCYGFSVTSLELFRRVLDPNVFGAATTSAIRIDRNHPIQQQLARAFAEQFLSSVRAAVLTGTPNEQLDRLRQLLVPDAPETYTIAIFPGPDSGHAVTPYAIEDRGDGTFAVLVYDNNVPATTRAIIFDTRANTWAYNLDPKGSPDGLWQGDAESKTLELFPTSPGHGVQPCPFCGDRNHTVEAPGSSGYKDVFLQTDRVTDHPHVVITDHDGRRSGHVGTKLVNEIPGVEVITPTLGVPLWRSHSEPVYRIPDHLDVKVTVDGATLEQPDRAGLVVVGPGVGVGVHGIDVRPHETATVKLDADNQGFTFESTSRQSPKLQLGLAQPGVSHAFTVSPPTLRPASAFAVRFAGDADRLAVSSTHTPPSATYDVRLHTLTTSGTTTSVRRNLPLGNGVHSVAVPDPSSRG